MKTIAIALGAGLMLGDRALAPSINVLGAFFPAWLFCAGAALALTAIVRLVVRRRSPDPAQPSPILAYLALWASSALAAWVLIFQN